MPHMRSTVVNTVIYANTLLTFDRDLSVICISFVSFAQCTPRQLFSGVTFSFTRLTTYSNRVILILVKACTRPMVLSKY